MNEELQKKFGQISKNCGIWKDFYRSFSHLPNPFQNRIISRIASLVDEVNKNPEDVLNYDRDLASASEYFPDRPEILESGELFPFRTIMLPDKLNKDLATINFVSCFLVKKAGLGPIICQHFCNFDEKEVKCLKDDFTNRRINLISCYYRSFEDLDG